jgi:hypothetical protein
VQYDFRICSRPWAVLYLQVVNDDLAVGVGGVAALGVREGVTASVPLAEGATTASPPTKDEIEKLLAVSPKYGIEIRLPGP